MRPRADYSDIRGFNHEPHLDHRYDPVQTRRELGYAERLHLNSCRLFLRIELWDQGRDMYIDHVRDFLDEAHRRSITVTPILLLAYGGGEGDPAILGAESPHWPPLPACYDPRNYGLGEEFVRAVVSAFRDHPALLFWDVQNEPSWNFALVRVTDDDELARRMKLVWAFTRHFIALVRTLDPDGALGVGHTYIEDTEESDTGELVDVILFHDYSRTRARARRVYERAVELGQKYGKPVINNETGVLSRGGTYDMELELAHEYGMGWYVFKLMIEEGLWETNHGIVYADGTVRDPAIVAALFGFFRNRDPQTVVLPNVDLELNATRAVQLASTALREHADEEELLDAAEFLANMLEGGELVPMGDGPNAQIRRLLADKDHTLQDVRSLTRKFTVLLRDACHLL